MLLIKYLWSPPAELTVIIISGTAYGVAKMPCRYSARPRGDAVKIARHFSAGNQARRMKLVPLGTIEALSISTVPTGLAFECIQNSESRH